MSAAEHRLEIGASDHGERTLGYQAGRHRNWVKLSHGFPVPSTHNDE
jgi:hypothetical protein